MCADSISLDLLEAIKGVMNNVQDLEHLPLSIHNHRISAQNRCLILNPNGPRMVHNPNVAPSSYPMKFCGLFGMVAPGAHSTQ